MKKANNNSVIKPEPILIEETKKIGRIGEGCLSAVVANTGYFLKRTNLEDDYGVDFETLLFFIYIFFFFNDTATTEIYTLSLHDALPI